MKIICFGSLNVDIVLQVDHFVAKGETLSSTKTSIFAGGKGLNQAIACSRANSEVMMAGLIGQDGNFLKELLLESSVDVECVKSTTGLSGAAYIQVDPSGANCILLAPNANHEVSLSFIDEVLAKGDVGDIVLLQNEINNLDVIMEKAAEKGLTIVLNPSPMNDALRKCPLHLVDWFILNEVEGQQITQCSDALDILNALDTLFPKANVVLTLGEAGSIAKTKDGLVQQKAYRVKAVDTTAAGDTFTGYFLSGIVSGKSVAQSMELAAKASAITVTRHGAAPSIPRYEEVLEVTLE